MNYKSQLVQPEWQRKRDQILNRDSFKCRECFNASYQNSFNSGLIFSNQIEHKSPKSFLHNERFILKIWDMKCNKIQTSFITDKRYNCDKSYIAFYGSSFDYSNIVGLKIILNEDIELSPNIIDIVKLGIRGRVTEDTYNRIYETIIKSDNWEILNGLHIHHTYYQEGKLAWEYDNSVLETLCWVCHEKLHKDKTIPILDSLGNSIGIYTNCKRCSGAGYFPEFDYVNSGICFRCDGNRYEELRV